MKLASVLVLTLSCLGLCSGSAVGSPVEKVTKLLVDMQTKIKLDGVSEKAAYEKYSCWCTSMTSKKAKSIEGAKTEIKKLGNEILALRSKVARLSSEINDAAKVMQDNHNAQQQATAMRQKENAAFTATRAEMGQAIQALQQALRMLSAAGKSSALLQRSKLVSAEATDAVRSAINAIPAHSLGSLSATKLAQLQSLSGDVAKGKVNYNPSYGSLVGILKEMYSTFSTDLERETATEAKSNKDFEGLMNTKVKEIKALQAVTDKKEEEKAQAAVDLAQTTQSYDDTDGQMNADIKFFDQTLDSCTKKAKAWQVRTAMREEELKGVESALAILMSDDARKLFSKAINAGDRMAFLQIGAVPMSLAQKSAFQLLKKQATKTQSMVLAKIAAQVRLAKGGHFAEVMGAISKIVTVLKDEQEADNNKKTQCNEERHKIAKSSAKSQWKIEKNDAKIGNLENAIANKEKEKAATIVSIKDVRQQMKDMTKERKAERESFAAGKKDDQDAVKLLKSAKEALLAFSKKHKALAAFIQGEPNFSDKNSRSNQSNSIATLLVTLVEGLEDEIRVQTKVEKDAVESYRKAMKAAGELQKDLKGKQANLEKAIAERKQDTRVENKKKSVNTKDLNSELDYKDKIGPDCDFIINNFADRAKKRTAEMEGLVQAKQFLAGAMGPVHSALLQSEDDTIAEPEDGSDELQADSDAALFGGSDEDESDSALYGNALLQQDPADGSDELQAGSDAALFGGSDEDESDSALYGNALLQQEPEDGSDELQAGSDEALFGNSDQGESDSALYGTNFLQVGAAPADELAKEMTHDLELNFNKIAPFGKEDTAKELQDHASKTQDTLVDAVENAEVAEIKRAVFRALTRLRAATIKEFDTIARLETQAIDAYNDAHHYRAENPLAHLHEDEAPVETDKLKSFH